MIRWIQDEQAKMQRVEDAFDHDADEYGREQARGACALRLLEFGVMGKKLQCVGLEDTI